MDQEMNSFPMLSGAPWQMSYGERAALEGVVAQLRPVLAVEVGTAEGGSLRRIAAHSQEVHSFDLVAPPPEIGALANVTFHTGDSHALLPAALAAFTRAGRPVDFILIDGDHTAEGVRRDLCDVLASPAVRRTVVLLHDTMNDAVRAGVRSADLAAHEAVAFVDLDFVPGYLARREPYRLQLWGGLGLVVVDAERGFNPGGPVFGSPFHDLFAVLGPARDVLVEIEARREPLHEHPPELVERLLREEWTARRPPAADCPPGPPEPPADASPPSPPSPAPATDLAGHRAGVPERFVPEQMADQLVGAEHLLRYWWATAHCGGRDVLDAGCGVGYGAAMLEEAGARSVTAVDVSPPVVDVARTVVSGRVSCEVADLRALPFPDSSFDLAACFEVIEHVEDQEAVLDELRRVLRPDGLLLISSPNRDRYPAGNPHHHHEYVPSELQAALESRFAAVRLLRQHAMIASVLTPVVGEDRFESARVRRLASPSPDDEVYTLAIAGRHLPDGDPPLLSLTRILELRAWIEHGQRQHQVLTEQAELLREMEALRRDRLEALGQLAEREQRLAEIPSLRDQLREERAHVETLTGELDQLDPLRREIDQLQAKLSLSAGVVAAMNDSLSWRLTAPVRAVKSRLER